jgi:ketosteroid isomerase-like protein
VLVAEWMYRSTNTGPLTMADGTVVPPTGTTNESRGVTIIVVKDGRTVAARDYYDAATEVGPR